MKTTTNKAYREYADNLTFNLYNETFNLKGAAALESYSAISYRHSIAVTMRNSFLYLLNKDAKLESWRHSVFFGKDKEETQQALHLAIMETYQGLETRCKQYREGVKGIKPLRVTRTVTNTTEDDDGNIVVAYDKVKEVIQGLQDLTSKELFWLMVLYTRNEFRRYLIEQYASINTHISIDAKIYTIGLDEYGDGAGAIVDSLDNKAALMEIDTVELLASLQGSMSPGLYRYVLGIIEEDKGAKSGRDNERIRKNAAVLELLGRLHVPTVGTHKPEAIGR